MGMQNAHLAIASVPVQNWGCLYDQDAALKNGTVFQDLDLPFFAAEQVPGPLSAPDPALDPEEQKRHEKILEIQKVSFMMDDLRLYLDTHPDDQDALSLLKHVLGKRKLLLAQFASEFYPLTMDCMAEIYEREPASACYCWQKGPVPWEGACC